MEREAFDQQLWELRVAMLRVAGSILKQPQDVEDAVSAAVVLAYQRRDALRSDESLKPWLMTITVRCCYRQLEKARREQPVEQPEPPPIFPSQWQGTLYEGLQALPPSLREALTLYYFEGMDTAQIARILSLSRTGVSMRLLRGRKLMKAWLLNAD